jgi:hypothetical protein
MSSKLTKDQKREKKKREERKRQLRKEHESNRYTKKMGGLFAALMDSMGGFATQDQLDDAILRLGTTKSANTVKAESIVQGPIWAKLKRDTSQMVRLLQEDKEAQRVVVPALQGRVYVNGDTGTDFSALFFPLFALFSSGWHPNTAVWETSKEYDPAPTYGAYFFGIEVRELAAHFAVASMADEESTPEVYFVSAKGWHRLDLEIWNNDLLPMVGRMMSAGRLNDEINSMERAIAYLIAQSGDVEEEALIGGELKPLNETARNTVRSIGSDLLLECEMVLNAANEARSRAIEEAATTAWNEGFEARQQEVDEALGRCRALELENRQLRSARVQAQSAPKDGPQRPVVPLEQRMGALLGV